LVESPFHWIKHITDPVLFLDAIREAQRLGGSCFVELGPRAVLAKLAKQCIPGPSMTFVACQEPPRESEGVWKDGIAKIRQAGVMPSPITPAGEAVDVLASQPQVSACLQRFPYRRMQHPLLKDRREGPDGTTIFAVPIQHSLASVLKQHVVHGRVVVPGALHIELAAAAARAVHGEDNRIVLEEVTFVSPVVIEQSELDHQRSGRQGGIALFCIIHVDDKKFNISLGRADSDPESLTLRVEGFYRVLVGAAIPSSSSCDLSIPPRLDVMRDCGHVHDPEAVYQHFERKGLLYGPHFRTLTGISGSRRYAQASLYSSLVGHGMFAHPCLLDGILQTSAGLFLDSLATTPARMPFTVERIEFLRPLPARIRVLVARADDSTDDALLKLDLAVYSDQDELLMTFKGLQSRPAQPTLQSHPTRKTHMVYQQSYRTEVVSNTIRDLQLQLRHKSRLLYLVVGERLDSFTQLLMSALSRHSKVVQVGDMAAVTAIIANHKANSDGLQTICIDCRAGIDTQEHFVPAVQDGLDPDFEESLAKKTLKFYAEICQADHAQIPDFIVHITSGLIGLQRHTSRPRGAALAGMARAFKVEQYHIPVKIMALDIQVSQTDFQLVIDELESLVLSEAGSIGSNLNSAAEVGLCGNTRSTPLTVLAPIDPESSSGFEAGRSALVPDQDLHPEKRMSHVLAVKTNTFLEENAPTADRFIRADAELQRLCTQLMAEAAWAVEEHQVTPHLLRLWHRYRSTTNRPAVGKPQLVGKVRQLDADLLGPQVNLLMSTAPELSGVLTGRVDPLTLLFSDQNAQAASALYKSTFLAKHFNSLIADAIRDIIQSSEKSLPPDYTIHILEIGAGTGGTASYVLPALATLGVRVRYVFTDLSSSLLARASKTFARYDFVDYRVLNVESPCEPQGFAAESFDFILATNVLHATSNLPLVMAHIRDLMLPGGRLIVSELTKVQPFADCTFGLTTGWNAHSDRYRLDGPLLHPRAWFELFRSVPGLVPTGHSPLDGIFANQAILTAIKTEAGPHVTDMTRPFAKPFNIRRRLTVQSDATYLITGGLGGLGILTAKVMVELGARHLVLVSRSGKPAPGSDGDWQDLLSLCRARNVQLVPRACDVSDEWQVQDLFRSLDSQSELPRIRGVVHGAGILSDGTFPAQTPESYHLVLKTKAYAAHIIQKHLLISSLDFFLSYSSVAGLLGAPGQSNHTVANELLDRAAESGWAANATLSVQWGAVSQIGDAARRGAADEDKRRSTVHEAIPKDTAVLLIRKLFTVSWQRPVVTFVPFIWQNLWRSGNKFASARFAPFKPSQYMVRGETAASRLDQDAVSKRSPAPVPLRNLAISRPAEKESRPTDAPGKPSVSQDPGVDVGQIVQEAIDHVLGRSIEGDETFAEAGVDSLGAIDFRNYLQGALRGLRLSATLLFEYPTKPALLEYLDRQVRDTTPLLAAAAADAVTEQQENRKVEAREPTGTAAGADPRPGLKPTSTFNTGKSQHSRCGAIVPLTLGAQSCLLLVRWQLLALPASSHVQSHWMSFGSFCPSTLPPPLVEFPATVST
jgi:NAD(P)-dependent dehydrogenase (short-subunit alcohol dehydrogenase family)/SAM-dependent methyltransferase